MRGQAGTPHIPRREPRGWAGAWEEALHEGRIGSGETTLRVARLRSRTLKIILLRLEETLGASAAPGSRARCLEPGGHRVCTSQGRLGACGAATGRSCVDVAKAVLRHRRTLEPGVCPHPRSSRLRNGDTTAELAGPTASLPGPWFPGESWGWVGRVRLRDSPPTAPGPLSRGVCVVLMDVRLAAEASLDALPRETRRLTSLCRLFSDGIPDKGSLGWRLGDAQLSPGAYRSSLIVRSPEFMRR